MSENYMNKYPVVHIYSQYSHHMDAIILGNEKGLVALRDAINEAIFPGNNKSAKVEIYVNDGECYTVYIKMTDDIDKLPVPYTADYAQDKSGVNPESFLK